jgi:hypothetical protein
LALCTILGFAQVLPPAIGHLERGTPLSGACPARQLAPEIVLGANRYVRSASLIDFSKNMAI